MLRKLSVMAATLACCASLTMVFQLEPSAAGGDKPGTIPYDGCGTLEGGGECMVFVGDDGAVFPMGLLLEFGVGDYVHLVGEVCPECPSFCDKGPAFQLQQITACDGFVDECGMLIYQGVIPDVCVVFQGSTSGKIYAVDFFGPTWEFWAGDYVRVTGTLASGGNCPIPGNCGTIDGCIPGNTMQACGEVVDECGTLVPFGAPFFCLAFMSESGHLYAIEESGPFGPGSRVRVTGTTFTPCVNGCGPYENCIVGNTIIPCPDITADGVVNVQDVLALIGAWGFCGTHADCPADLNLDMFIDVEDLLMMIGYWGT